MPLRQTEGFVASLIGLMGLGLKTPDHTTMSRRSRDVEAPCFAQSGGPLHLVIDPTGLKILGDGEWQSHQHKTSNQRRSWRQLHLGIDGDGYLIASALTDRPVDDACVAISMLEQIDRLRAQHREAQKTEALIAVNIINRMTALGMPESAKIVA